MSESRTFVAVAIGIALIAGCSETEITEASPDRSPLMSAHGGASIDISGDWLWSREEHLIFPAWVAELIFGIQPEGPTTSARCSGSGTMSLVQTGNTFSGVATSEGGQCTTRGGQVFAGVAPNEPIVDGQIRGKSVRFHLIGAGGSVDCAMHAVISEIQAGTASALTGGGHCIVPGHPKSPIPLDPPPGGVQNEASFTANRAQ